MEVSKVEPRDEDIETGDNGVVRASSRADVNGVEGPARASSDCRGWSGMSGLSSSLSLARRFPLSSCIPDDANPLRSAILPRDP